MICPNCRCDQWAGGPDVEAVGVVLAPPRKMASGLMAWASAAVGPLKIDGFAVRRTQDDRLIVTWPARTTDDGMRHPIVAALDADVRRRVEAAVLGAYFEARRRAGRNSQ